MKQLFTYITILILFSSFNIFAQNSFEFILSKSEDQIITQLIEDDEGNFIFVGYLRNIETGFPGGYIIKTDSVGNLTNEIVLQYSDTTSYLLLNVHFLNGYYYLIGTRQFSYSITNLWFLKLNYNLDIITEKEFLIPDNKWVSYMNSIIDSDTNFVVTGYTTRNDTTTPSPYNNDPFFFKLSQSCDSIASNFITSNYHLSFSYDIVEKNDQTGYYSYGFKYSSLISNGGQRFDLTEQFDSIEIVSVPYSIKTFVSSAKLNDTLIILSGSGGLMPAPLYSLNALTTTMDNDPIDYNYFQAEGDLRDYAAIYRGVSLSENNIYIGGTSNFNYSNPFWSTNNSWFHLVKLNPDLTSIWEYWYGGDAYYNLYSVLATDDGGCIMVGNRYDYETQDHERDIYIAKVNNEGLLVGTHEEPAIEMREALVFPNPGTNYLKVRIAAQYKQSTFELFDINGHKVLSQQIKGKWAEVNTTFLQAGTYIYNIYNSEGLFESGKWVKR